MPPCGPDTAEHVQVPEDQLPTYVKGQHLRGIDATIVNRISDEMVRGLHCLSDLASVERHVLLSWLQTFHHDEERRWIVTCRRHVLVPSAADDLTLCFAAVLISSEMAACVGRCRCTAPPWRSWATTSSGC